MDLGLTKDQRIARLHADLRMGAAVTVVDGQTLWLLAAVETMRPGLLDGFRSVAVAGSLHVAVTARRAETLAARPYDDDLARLAVPPTVGDDWVRSLADPSRDLTAPLRGPYRSLREGSPAVSRAAIRHCKAARLLPAAAIARVRPDAVLPDPLPVTSLETFEAGLDSGVSLRLVATGHVPLRVSEHATTHVFRPASGGEEHFAIEIGRPNRHSAVLTRLHSACFTGDLLESLKCDCGQQLRAALGQMGAAGEGVLLYLNQEGRGIGLANKLRAYSLQDQGFDTVDANHRLGFEDDERDFRFGAEMLTELGFRQIRLMTNNPAKLEMIQRHGIAVTERVPLVVGRSSFNADYLDTKARKSGHLM